MIRALPKMRSIIQIKFYDRRSNRSITVSVPHVAKKEREREREEDIKYFMNTVYGNVR